MTRTANEGSPVIYTLRDGKGKNERRKRERKQKKSRREIHNKKSSTLRLLFLYKEETSLNNYSIVFRV